MEDGKQADGAGRASSCEWGEGTDEEDGEERRKIGSMQMKGGRLRSIER